MEQRRLGETDLKVSKICLGTMTWGEQNSEEEAFSQMDYAMGQGINFFDTAEIYAVPPRTETYGKTETMVGRWFKKTGHRQKIILATKMAGPRPTWVREGRGLVVSDIEEAINGSLKRLQTDTIDLYQLHWPQRQVPLWGKENYHPNMFDLQAAEQMEEFFYALSREQKKGRIRHIGVSNETAWGVMYYMMIARKREILPIVSIQNAYSLVRREYEVGLAEVSLHTKVGLLAYSPLAGGLLSGKYIDGVQPEKARFTLFPEMQSYYKNEKSNLAVKAYQKIAEELNLSLTQLSLAFVNQQAFVTSNIIGATTMDQLKENIATHTITLDTEVLKKIDDIFREYPNPGNF